MTHDLPLPLFFGVSKGGVPGIPSSSHMDNLDFYLNYGMWMVDVTGECVHASSIYSLGNSFIACLNCLQCYPLRVCLVESVVLLQGTVRCRRCTTLHLIAGPPIGDTHGPGNVRGYFVASLSRYDHNRSPASGYRKSACSSRNPIHRLRNPLPLWRTVDVNNLPTK